jgi:hypothetical protein
MLATTSGEQADHLQRRRWRFSRIYRTHDLKGDIHPDWLTYTDRGPVT